MRRKTAKDKAFEKEREKFRKKINRLIRENNDLKSENENLKEEVFHMDTKISEINDWNERLLEYIDQAEMEKIV